MFDGLKRMLGRIPGGRQVAGLDAAWRENMEHSEEGLLIIRPPSQVVHANGAAGVLLGRKSEELTNTVFPYALALGALTSIVVPRGKDDPMTLEAGAVTIAWQGAPAWLVTLRDVTASRRLNSMKSERVKVLERMALGVALADILVALVQFAESQYPQSICTVMLLDPDGIRLRYGASTRLPRPLIEVADKFSMGPGQGSCGTAAHERKAVIVTDIGNSPLWVGGRDVALESGIHACWSIPIFSSGGDVIGTFATYYPTPRGPTTDEIDLVSACAQVTGVAIERHRSEAQLKLLESSIAHVNDMVIITDIQPIDEPGPRMVFVNDALLRHTGYRREQLLGKSPRLFQGPLTQRDQLDRIHDALAARLPVRVEVINYTSTGEPFWVELEITAIAGARGRATHFVSVQRDITEYKRIQAAMQRSDERFRLVARLTTDVIWDRDLLTNELWWSEGIETLFGHKVPEAGTDIEAWKSWLHLDDRDRVADGIDAVIHSGGEEWTDEYRFMRRDGSYAHVIDKGFVTYDKMGRAVRMVGGIKDVTERHEAEANARRTSQTQALIVRAQRQIAESGLDLDGVKQLIAQRAQELTGASGASVATVENDAFVYRAATGSAHRHLGLRISRERSLAALALRTGEPQICHDCQIDPGVDAQAYATIGARSLMCVALNRLDIDSALLSVVSNRSHAFDVRDLANLEILADSLGSALQRALGAEQLQKSEAKYRMLFEGNPQPMLVYDRSSLRFLAVNAAAVQHYGYSREAFLALTVPELHPASDALRLKEHLQEPQQKRQALPWRHLTSLGEIIDVEISSDELMFEGRSARLALVVDITHRLKGERELLRISRARLMLSRCNEAMVHAESEQQLYDAMCRISVETGGYRLAWVGLAMDDDACSISHVASAGEGLEYLTDLSVSWSAHSEAGQGPSGRTIREGVSLVIEDIGTDPVFARWAQQAQRHGFRAVVCLPLHGSERTFGHLMLYSASTLPIGAEELKLMQELAVNLAYGIEYLRVGIERRHLQAAVTRVATAVSSTDDKFFFDQLCQAMVEAVGADAGFIVRMPPKADAPAQVIAAAVDGQGHRITELMLQGTPCQHLDREAICVIADDPDLQFSELKSFGVQDARAFAGRRLDGADGHPIGLLFVLFRKPLRRPDFVLSTLGIFAIRAAAELEQRAASTRDRDQASLRDKSHDAILAGDMNQRITFWNKAAERLYGWAAEEILGVGNLEDIYPDPTIVKGILARLLSENEWNGPLKQRRKDGRIMTVEAHITLIRDEDGSPRFFLVIAAEVDSRRNERN
jgi:PAS domain S-box-containing protein